MWQYDKNRKRILKVLLYYHPSLLKISAVPEVCAFLSIVHIANNKVLKAKPLQPIYITFYNNFIQRGLKKPTHYLKILYRIWTVALHACSSVQAIF